MYKSERMKKMKKIRKLEIVLVLTPSFEIMCRFYRQKLKTFEKIIKICKTIDLDPTDENWLQQLELLRKFTKQVSQVKFTTHPINCEFYFDTRLFQNFMVKLVLKGSRKNINF